MPKDRSEVLQGALDLTVLNPRDALGPLHGYRIARCLEQLSEEMLHLNEGTVYASLLRPQQRGWVRYAWGRKQLAPEAESWERIAGVIGPVLRLERGS
jgi:PadR family transcriptional regulator PadR